MEGGVAQQGDPKLNNISGAIRVGTSLDRRGIVRLALTLSGAGVREHHVGLSGGVELRPLSPRRISPILGGGVGVLMGILDYDYGGRKSGYAYLTAGMAVRVTRTVGFTLRGLVGDGANSYKLYSLHFGMEFGR